MARIAGSSHMVKLRIGYRYLFVWIATAAEVVPALLHHTGLLHRSWPFPSDSRSVRQLAARQNQAQLESDRSSCVPAV